MIAWRLILEAGTITAVAVAVAATTAQWQHSTAITAAIGTLVLIVGWRGIANAAHLNDDFVPLVSVGDVGCILAGALAPAALAGAATRANPWRLTAPALVGGLVGFVVNVVIL